MEPSQWGETGLTAVLGLARVRKYSNLVHLVYSASTEQDERILDRRYVILGCVCGAQSKGGNGRYCTFGPRARTVVYEFSDFGVLWQYTAVHVQM